MNYLRVGYGTLTVMRSATIKRILAVTILAATVVLFARYYAAHPQYWHLLSTISPWVIVWIILLNVAMTLVLTVMNIVTLRLCNLAIGWREMFLLTSYSSLANFFGPLQSGPGVRAVYLKATYKLRIRDYTLATLITLGIYALWNIVFLLIGTRPWWQTLLAFLAVGGVCGFVISHFKNRDSKGDEASHFVLYPSVLVALVILTFLQIMTIAGWYFVELRAVDPHIGVGQVLSYTGAANFSLFVSITPDAVGIREAFLVFSQHIHHVPTRDIVSANVIDRAVYIVYLILLFAVVLAMHAKEKLQLTKLKLRR